MSHPSAPAPSGEALLEVDGLGKRFDIYPNDRSRFFELVGNRTHHVEHWALRGLSFRVPRGRAFGVIGSNGAGKSTLLRLLAGITEPTEGTIGVYGRMATLLDLGVGFHEADRAMNSPIGQAVMDVGGHIPGPVGTAFEVVSVANDLCVMHGCIECMPLLLCGSRCCCVAAVAVVWQPLLSCGSRCCCVAANTPAGTTTAGLEPPWRAPRLRRTCERCRQYDGARTTSTMPKASAPRISPC